MDFRERLNDPQEAVRAALDGHQSQVWTAIPGIVQTVDLTKSTVTVQPAIQAQEVSPQGKRTNVNIPLLQDVPIHFPSGGGYTATFPVKAGDEVLVIFAARCIDNWWQEGGVQPQFERRMHDLSDGFAIPKVWSQKTKLDNISTTTAQLRSDDGKRFVEIDTPNKKVRAITDDVFVDLDSSAGTINMSAPNEIKLQSDRITLIGQTQVTAQAQTVQITGNNTINLNAPAINEN